MPEATTIPNEGKSPATVGAVAWSTCCAYQELSKIPPERVLSRNPVSAALAAD